MEHESSIDRSCEKNGCAKIGLDPKLHFFDDCFGRGIKFGDVDGAVERNGYILWMEWKVAVRKDSFEKVHFAQILQAKHFTRNSNKQLFVFVEGDPLKMEIRNICKVRGGEVLGWEPCTSDGFKDMLRNWFYYADRAAH